MTTCLLQRTNWIEMNKPCSVLILNLFSECKKFVRYNNEILITKYNIHEFFRTECTIIETTKTSRAKINPIMKSL